MIRQWQRWKRVCYTDLSMHCYMDSVRQKMWTNYENASMILLSLKNNEIYGGSANEETSRYYICSHQFDVDINEEKNPFRIHQFITYSHITLSIWTNSNEIHLFGCFHPYQIFFGFFSHPISTGHAI